MLIISHRGNLQGPSPFENQPSQIDICLEAGFDCEIDLRVENDELFLGHDSSQYKIIQDWLFDRKEKLWIHCKNFNAIALMQSLRSYNFNFFWHQSDDYTLTSNNKIWVFPNQYLPKGSIAVLPETWITEARYQELSGCFAICTDLPENYKGRFD